MPSASETISDRWIGDSSSSDDDISKFLSGLKSPKGANSISATPPKEKTETQPNQSTDKILQSMPKMPEPPKLHDIPTAQDQQFHSPFKDFSGPMLFMAALGSLMTRHPAKVAMDSFSSMVNANVAGQKDVIQQARENMKAATETVIKQNEVEIERYKLVMEKHKDDASQVAAAMMAQASGFNDPMMQAMVKTGNMANVWSYIQDREKRGDQLREFQLKQATEQETERHHRATEGGNELIGDEEAKTAAEQLLAGDKSALTGWGRGAQGAQNLSKIRNTMYQLAKERGMSGAEIAKANAAFAGETSAARALGTQETRFGVAEKAMEESIPLAQRASDAVPRGDWVDLNRLIQLGQTKHSNPAIGRFLIATDTAAKDYARTINPTGVLRDADIQYARKILSTADGPEAYKAKLDQLQQEAGIMHRAIQRQKGEQSGKAAGSQPSTGDGEKSGWSIEEVH